MKVSLQITLSVPEQKKKKKRPAYQHVEVGLDGREERCRQCEKVNKSHTVQPWNSKWGEENQREQKVDENKTSDE